jgi:hypothetical protein
VRANLLDDGVLDTLVSVGASDVHTSVFHQRLGQRGWEDSNSGSRARAIY